MLQTCTISPSGTRTWPRNIPACKSKNETIPVENPVAIHVLFWLTQIERTTPITKSNQSCSFQTDLFHTNGKQTVYQSKLMMPSQIEVNHSSFPLHKIFHASFTHDWIPELLRPAPSNPIQSPFYHTKPLPPNNRYALSHNEGSCFIG